MTQLSKVNGLENTFKHEAPPSFSEMIKFSENPYPGTNGVPLEGEWSDYPKDSEASKNFIKGFNTSINPKL